jgi:hypothetical protein
MQIDESDEQPENARSEIDESCDPDSNTTAERLLQCQKQSSPSFSTQQGMQIDKRVVANANAKRSIEHRLEPDSNVTVKRDRHPATHCSPRVSTDEGMQIDESDEHFENARSPIEESFEPYSNVIAERELRPRQQYRLRFAIEDGMQILATISAFALPDAPRPRSSTVTMTPLSETKLRGNVHPRDLECPAQNAFVPSDLYDRVSSSIETKSRPEHSGPVVRLTRMAAEDNSLFIGSDSLSANPPSIEWQVHSIGSSDQVVSYDISQWFGNDLVLQKSRVFSKK